MEVIKIKKKTLCSLRLEKELSQEALATMLGVSRKKIYRYENGLTIPSDQIKQQLGLIFYLSRDDLDEVIKNTIDAAKEKSQTYPCTISFRCTTDMYSKIEANAKMANMTVGQYVRETYAGGQLVVLDGLKDFSKDLTRIGTNLNQLTKLCHMGKINAPELKSVQKTLTEIYIKLNRIISK